MATAPAASDAALVRRLRERDRTAWEEVYAAYGQRLHAFAYRLAGNEHDAADLVQETFCRALPRLDRIDPETVELGPYLFTTTRNLFLKSVERRKRVEPVEEVPEPAVPAPIEDDPERSTLLHTQQEEVRIANARLAPRQRLVLALRELEDKSYAEIGEVVGLNENAVAQLISRSRDSLRTELRLTQVDPERLPDECRQYLPLLSRHLDGQLKGAQLDATLMHLESCSTCQEALDSMREAQRRYRSLIPPLAGGMTECDEALAANGYWNSPRRAGLRLRSRAAVVAAAGAAVALIGGGGLGAALLFDNEPVAAPAATTTAAASTAATEPPSPPPPRQKTPGDTTAPRARFTAGPAAVTLETRAVFAFAASEQRARFRCRLDRQPVRDCASPNPIRRLRAGGHVFAVRAIDSAGNAGPWLERRWVVEQRSQQASATATTPAAKPTPARPKPSQPGTTTSTPPAPPAPAPPAPPPPPPPVPVDRRPPHVTITRAPAGTTATGTVQVAFTADETGVRFACSLDGAAFAPCASPVSLAVAPGQHTFEVRAEDRAGNTGAPARASWTFTPPDTTAPTVTITSGPPATSASADATFSFSASEAGSTFACSLDGASFAACSSPIEYPGLAAGPHTFSVRATDVAGNTSAAATRQWTFVPPLPDLVITQLTATTVTVSNSGGSAAGPFVLRVTPSLTFTFAGLAPGQSASRTWSSCRPGTISAVADAGQTVVESNERNNTASITNVC